MSSSSDGKYTQKINSKNPGLILILLDQSYSMRDPYASSKKKDVAADAVNQVIYEVRKASQEGSEIIDRCYLGVIGYGEVVGPLAGGNISEFSDTVLEIKIEKRIIVDENGNKREIDWETPIWVKPKAENGTPMNQAFEQAFKLISEWVNHNPDSFPPVVINITDGMPNDLQRGGDGTKTVEAAKKLMNLGTNDGKLLLFNAHISDPKKGEMLLPSNINDLSDPFAQYLFQISSVIPSSMFDEAQDAGFSMVQGARGMVFNAGAESLTKLLNFGSSRYH